MQTSLWEFLPSMHVARARCAATVLDGCIVVMGGYNQDGDLKAVEQYWPAAARWTELPSMCRAPCFTHFPAVLPIPYATIAAAQAQGKACSPGPNGKVVWV